MTSTRGEQFVEDLRLVFKNAVEFNRPAAQQAQSQKELNPHFVMDDLEPSNLELEYVACGKHSIQVCWGLGEVLLSILGRAPRAWPSLTSRTTSPTRRRRPPPLLPLRGMAFLEIDGLCLGRGRRGARQTEGGGRGGSGSLVSLGAGQAVFCGVESCDGNRSTGARGPPAITAGDAAVMAAFGEVAPAAHQHRARARCARRGVERSDGDATMSDAPVRSLRRAPRERGPNQDAPPPPPADDDAPALKRVSTGELEEEAAAGKAPEPGAERMRLD